MGDTKIFDAILENFKNDYKIKSKDNIFNIFVTYQVCKNKMISIDDVIQSCIDGGGDGGIDNLLIFINDILIQTESDYNNIKQNINTQSTLDMYILQNKESRGFAVEPLNKINNTIQNIFNEEMTEEKLRDIYNLELIEQIQIIRNMIKEIIPKLRNKNINVNIIFSNKSDSIDISKDVRNAEEILRNNIKKYMCIENININYNGKIELKKLYDSGYSSILQLKTKNIIYDTYREDRNIACMALVNIADYYNFISTEDEQLKEYLFDNNVRDYQENTNRVNEEIFRTLDNEKDIDFWWLNNGVTILVEELELKPGYINLTMPRIVNGLQTSYCIYNSITSTPPLFKEKEYRSILVKIIQANDEKTMESIILATNNQTPINTSDLIANNEIQKNIEEYFKSKGYFYERRDNFYSRKSDIEQNKVIQKSQLAQYCMTVLQKSPSIARNNPKTILYKHTYEDIFNKEINVDIYFKICLLYGKISQLVDETSKDEDILKKKYGTSIVSFKLHLLLINTILLLKNKNFTNKELQKLEIYKYEEKIYKDSIDILLKILEGATDKNKLYYAKTKQIDFDILNYSYKFDKK